MQKKSYFGKLGELKKIKEKNGAIIAICGCMMQEAHIQQKLKQSYPFVDIIIGTNTLHKLPEDLYNKLISEKKINDILDIDGKVYEGLPIKRNDLKKASVTIMYGCNNFCTYCIVPYVRGREVSRSKQDILNEIKEVIATNTYKTITLLGQNVNSYGNDDKNQGTFAELLDDICKLDGDFKLTFMTSHPKDLSDELIDVMKNNDKIIKEIHLPVQSGSNKILKAMNRHYTVEHYLELIGKLRKEMPNIRITTDIIVGFPGETDEDFMSTCELVKKVKYDGIFAFMYSKRSGTVAEKMPDQVEECEKNRRVNYLLDLEKEIKSQKKDK